MAASITTGRALRYAGGFPRGLLHHGLGHCPASVSKTCLVSFDRNRYSVLATAVGRPVQLRAHARKIVIVQDGAVVGEHDRVFTRDRTIYDPWHYLPVLERKPGALRNGAPFKGLSLPPGDGEGAGAAHRPRA